MAVFLLWLHSQLW